VDGFRINKIIALFSFKDIHVIKNMLENILYKYKRDLIEMNQQRLNYLFIYLYIYYIYIYIYIYI